ncbi:ATP-dependent RecD-like DNA helicase [Devosia sp. BK]|nr:ATP-dependent RecD-like DNA helicase [Devosia sp. BK]
MQVSIDTILSQREFGTIFSATVLGNEHPHAGTRLRFKALTQVLTGKPGVGEVWTIEGRGRDTVHGHQVEVQRGRRVMSGGVLMRRFLANHAPGIGEERATRLWNAFGVRLNEVLEDDSRLQAVADVLAPGKPVLGVRLAAGVMRCWRDAAGEAAVMTWLDNAGIEDVRLARRLYRLCGEETPRILEANPYALVPLVSWKTIDDIGRAILGRDVDNVVHDRRRLVGAVDECIKLTLQRGATALYEADLEEAIGKLLGIRSPVILGDAIAFAEQDGAVLRDGRTLRAPGAAAMEFALQNRFTAMVAGRSQHNVSAISEALALANQTLAPHPQQLEAARAVLSNPLSCLVGGAGTGKTYTCRLIVEAWEQLGGQVVLCALAGKAALRLSRSTSRLAKTLARTLAELAERERLEIEGADGADTKLDRLAKIEAGTLVLVDEASMVDLPTVHALVRRLPEGAHLLLVGDESQLPPVGFGLVFHQLVRDSRITVRLTQVHRQAASTGIPAVSAAVRERSLPGLLPYAGMADGVVHQFADLDSLPEAVSNIAEDLGVVDGEALIVAATNSGAAGVDSLNARLQSIRFERDNPPTMRGHLGCIFGIGDPVIFGRNDYAAGLVNGMMGRVTEIFPDTMMLEVAFEGEERRKLLDTEQIFDLSLAYAVTCHKCQGSSASRIIVPLYPTRLLDPSWLYTAITRAERQAVLVGPISLAEAALARPWVTEQRLVGFRWTGEGR